MRRWLERMALAGIASFAVAGCACSRVPRDDKPETEATPWRAAGRDKPAAPPRRGPAGPARTASPQLDPRVSLAVIQQALQCSDYDVRLTAVEALGSVRAVDPVPWLAHALGDPEHDVRVAAVEALGAQGTPQARAALATVRDDATEDLGIRALAASALLGSTQGGCR